MAAASLSSRLHDIQELDPAGFWPLAPGWWILLAAFLTLALLIYALRRWRPHWRHYLPRRGWAGDASRDLLALRTELPSMPDKAAAARLSELVRRIAIARCGRQHCAGLQGASWLAWLTEHDPGGFDWQLHGQLLSKLAYAPAGDSRHDIELRQLVDAALAWTSQARSCAIRREAPHGL